VTGVGAGQQGLRIDLFKPGMGVVAVQPQQSDCQLTGAALRLPDERQPHRRRCPQRLHGGWLLLPEGLVSHERPHTRRGGRPRLQESVQRSVLVPEHPQRGDVLRGHALLDVREHRLPWRQQSMPDLFALLQRRHRIQQNGDVHRPRILIAHCPSRSPDRPWHKRRDAGRSLWQGDGLDIRRSPPTTSEVVDRRPPFAASRRVVQRMGAQDNRSTVLLSGAQRGKVPAQASAWPPSLATSSARISRHRPAVADTDDVPCGNESRETGKQAGSVGVSSLEDFVQVAN
jgi:hypothetical protein